METRETIGDQTQIEELLRQFPGVVDCAVIRRRDDTGREVTLACLVGNQPLDVPGLRRHFAGKTPQTAVPECLLQVDSLPFNADGQVDWGVLMRIPVIEDTLIAAWKEQLLAVPGIRRVALREVPAAMYAPRIHLRDVLGDDAFRPSDGAFEPSTPSEIAGGANSSVLMALPPALTETKPEPILAAGPGTLPEALVFAAAAPHGAKITYLENLGRERVQTLGDLLLEGRQIAQGLLASGMRAGDPALILLPDNADILPSFWGCVLSGCIPLIAQVPASFDHPGRPLEQLTHAFRLLEQPCIVTNRSLRAPLLAKLDSLGVKADRVLALEALRMHPPLADQHQPRPEDVAIYNLTSGSTGVPKCIALTHQNLIARARGTNILLGAGPGNVAFSWLSFDHIGSISDWHVRCVVACCSALYAPTDGILARPLSWLELIERYRVTHSWAPNFAYALLNDALNQHEQRDWKLEQVECLLTAGEPVSRKVVQTLLRHLQGCGLRPSAIRPAFGMAEMGSGVTYYEPTGGAPQRFLTVHRASLGGPLQPIALGAAEGIEFTSLGRVIPGMSMRVVDEAGNLASELRIGRVQFRGLAVSRGYLHNREETAAVFHRDGWFEAGDLGFISEGELFITGRAKETIILNGANFYSVELENVVESVAGVEVAFTAALAVSKPNEATDGLAVFFHPLIPEECWIELIRTIRKRLVRDLGAAPDYVIPLARAAIPKTAIGKIQRSQLRRRFQNGEFDPILKQLDLLARNDRTMEDGFFRPTWRGKELRWRNRFAVARAGLFLLNHGYADSDWAQALLQGQRGILVERGLEFHRHNERHYVVRSGQVADFKLLVAAVLEDFSGLDFVLHCGGENGKSVPPGSEVLEDCLVLLRLLEQHNSGRAVRLQIAALPDLAPVKGSPRESMPVAAFLAAAGREYPWLTASYVDLRETPRTLWAQLLAGELAAGEPLDREVAYHGGNRMVRTFEQLDLLAHPHCGLPFQEGGVYLLAVGHGRTTLELARFLLGRFRARVVLCAPGEQAENLSGLGAELRAFRATAAGAGEIQELVVDGDSAEALKEAWEQSCASNAKAEALHGIVLVSPVSEGVALKDLPGQFLPRALGAALRWTSALYELATSSRGAFFLAIVDAAAFLRDGLGGLPSLMQAASLRWLEHQQLVGGLPALICGCPFDGEPGAPQGNGAGESRSSQAGLSAPQALAGLNRRLPYLIGGISRGRRFDAASYREPATRRLAAYYSVDRLFDPKQLESIRVADRFGTRSECAFIPMREPEPTVTRQTEWWPSVAEYFVYDELIYYALANDERRNRSYRAALNRMVKDKIVVEIGTGREAILTRFCAEAGARKIYAIEIGESAYAAAQERIRSLGLEGRVSIIRGDAREVVLPELADVCVSEIVGPIGGCEGAAVLLNDCRRLLKPGGQMIPGRSLTKIAALRCPDELVAKPGFKEVPGAYVGKIFEQVGAPFDLRLCVKGLDYSYLLSDAGVFEDLDFNQPMTLEGRHEVRLTCQKPGRWDGFLVWLNLQTMDGEVIDILEFEYSWLPVFLPVFDPGLMVEAGDVWEIAITRSLNPNRLNPDFLIEGRLCRRLGGVVEFRHNSPNHGGGFKQSPFHARLFASHPQGLYPRDKNRELLRYLREFPLTTGLAVDEARLSQLVIEATGRTEARVSAGNATERQIATIWQDVLGVPEVQRQDNFFEQGGHSLLLVQTQGRLKEAFGRSIELVDLFKYPTVAALAGFLDAAKQETSPKASREGRERADRRRLGGAVPATSAEIAVIGIACRFPGSASPTEFWHNLTQGLENITYFSRQELAASGIDPRSMTDPNYIGASPVLEGVEFFDAGFFEFSAKEAELMDPQHRIFLECAWEALEDAGYDPLNYPGAVGIYAGASMSTYLLNNVYPNRHRLDPQDDLGIATLDSMGGFQMMVAQDKDYLTTRVSYKLNLKGPSVNVQTACSTSLVTMHMAAQALQTGEADLMLAGGVSVKSPQVAGHLYQQGMIVSPDGHCRAFDARAQGTVFGSGAGIVVLKRLADAIADGDHIYAVIKGSAVNNDGGLKAGYMAPNGEGQAAVTAEALAAAGVRAETIGFVEAHGTGTPMGDPIEISGLTQAFRQDTDKKNFCAVGAVKTNIGHMQIASGVAGFIKAALALHHRQIPATLHFQTPNPSIDFANSPFYIPTRLLPWPAGEFPRRAGINSLGIGGTNAHVVLEEAPSRMPVAADRDRPWHVLALSAKTEAALADLVERYLAWLSANPQQQLGDLCFTANVGRHHFNRRLAVTARTPAELRAKLLDSRQQTGGEAPLEQRTAANGPVEIVFLFPDQGIPLPGGGRQLFDSQPVFRQSLEECAELLRGDLPVPLLAALYDPGHADWLNQTRYAQTVVFALEYSLARLWQSWGVVPAAALGQGVGEYVAACLAGVFPLQVALQLVVERARLLESLPSDGGMAVVFAPLPVVRECLRSRSRSVAIAAVQGARQVVISGELGDIQSARCELERDGFKVELLPGAKAFQSPLVEPLMGRWQEFLEPVRFSSPSFPIITSLHGTVSPERLATADYWFKQFRQPAQLRAGLETARRDEKNVFLEIGVGVVWSPIVLQDNPSARVLVSLRPDREDWDQILESLSRFYCAGGEVHWAAFEQPYPRRRLALPTYPFQRQRYWLEQPSRAALQTFPGNVVAATAKTAPHGRTSLLGRRLRTPLLRDVLFENRLDPASLPFLRDHLVFGKTVVSGACYVAMALEAAAEIRPIGSWALEEILFPRALVLPGGQTAEVQLVLSPEGAETHIFKLIQLIGSSDQPQWQLHATGRLRAGAAGSRLGMTDETKRWEEVWANHQTVVSAEDFYGLQRRHAIELGGSYRWIQEIRRRQGESACQIARPTELGGLTEDQLHPGLLDACFGLLVASVEMSVEETLIPFRIERIVWHQPTVGARYRAHCMVRPETRVEEGRILGDVRLIDEAGRLLGEIIGLEGRKAGRTELLGALEPLPDTFQIAWEPNPLSANRNGHSSHTPGRWLLFTSEPDATRGLVQRLEAQGDRCVLILRGAGYAEHDAYSYTLNPREAGDYARLLEACLRPGQAVCRGVVYLWDLFVPAAGPAESLDRIEAGCGGALNLVRALTARAVTPPPRLWLVTQGGQATGDAAAPLTAEAGALWGFGRAVQLEYPELACTCVELGSLAGDASAAALVEELRQDFSAGQVAWHNGARVSARLAAARLPEAITGRASLPGGTWLITGGTGSLGLMLTDWLVKEGARHVVLTSRTKPGSEVRGRMQGWEQQGARILHVLADAGRREDLAAVFQQAAAQCPPVEGIVHAAGILDDGVVGEQNWDRFAKVLAAKTAGARYLDELSRGLPLKHFILFSSAASVLGNAGQSSYAAANACLDILAHERQRQGLPATSVNWGPWAQAGMAARLDSAMSQFARLGIQPIEARAGLRSFAAVLSLAAPQIMVMGCDWVQYVTRFPQRTPFLAGVMPAAPVVPAPAPGGAEGPGQEIRRAQAKDRRRLLEKYVAEVAGRILSFDGSLIPDPSLPLMEQGMDSLTAVELRNTLRTGLGLALPVALSFNYPTIQDMAGFLAEEIAKEQGDRPEVVETNGEFDHLDGLGADELARVIEQDLLGARV